MSEWLRSGLEGKEMTFSGDWNRDSLIAAFGEPEHDVTIVAHAHKLGRLSIYKERLAFRARVSGYESTTDGIGLTHSSMQLQPVAEVRRIRAEWWRLALWYAYWPVRVIQRWTR